MHILSYITSMEDNISIPRLQTKLTQLDIYRDKRTARFSTGERVKEFLSFEKQAKKRLQILFSARSLKDLRLKT